MNIQRIATITVLALTVTALTSAVTSSARAAGIHISLGGRPARHRAVRVVRPGFHRRPVGHRTVVVGGLVDPRAYYPVRPVERVIVPVERHVVAPAVYLDLNGSWRYNQGTMIVTVRGTSFHATAYSDDGRITRLEGHIHGNRIDYTWHRLNSTLRGTGHLIADLTGDEMHGTAISSQLGASSLHLYR